MMKIAIPKQKIYAIANSAPNLMKYAIPNCGTPNLSEQRLLVNIWGELEVHWASPVAYSHSGGARTYRLHS